MTSKIKKLLPKLSVNDTVCICKKNCENFEVVGVQKITDQFLKAGDKLFSLLTGDGIKGSTEYYIRKYDEYMLQRYIVDWLKKEYPNVMFHSDTGSGVRLPQGLANKVKLLQKERAFPDFQIIEPRKNYHGLFLEFKIEGTKVKRTTSKPGKYGSYTTKHIQEQAEVLRKLRDRGYKAGFAVGIEISKKIIQNYLDH